MNGIDRNDDFELAYRFVTETQESVFLTGRAGTGKTTFLKYLCSQSAKIMLVAAPTGVAAINAGGVTLHSLFQLPLQPFLPTAGGRQQLRAGLRLSRQRQALLRRLELLVIDEISMVRCDVLDAIDTLLRHVRRNAQPFGGVQLLLIGDLYQLPPVARNEDWSLLSAYYGSPFFFDSHAIREQPPLLLELRTIYRQQEDRFIDLLNKVRHNQLSPEDYQVLNERFQKNFRPPAEESWITLTSHNHQADAINLLNLQQLPGASFRYEARVEDDFPENIYPADAVLTLREGAQVMFIRNDISKRYFNGKIGRVARLEENRIVVRCGREEIDVPPETWENTRYALNRSDERLEQQVVGRFTQYPLRLAWAVTIHKSQGLTFDRVMIDAAASFSSGQVYVALSRCTRLEGIVLLSRIPPAAISTSQEVNQAQATLAPRGSLPERFRGARQLFTVQLLHKIFVLEEVQVSFQSLSRLLQQHALQLAPSGFQWMSDFGDALQQQATIGEKFLSQVQQLLSTEPMVEQHPVLQQRIADAAAYFIPRLERLGEQLQQHALETEYREAATAIDEILQELQVALFRATDLMRFCLQPFAVSAYLQYQMNLPARKIRISCYASARKAAALPETGHPELYLRLREWRDGICRELGQPVYMVAANSTLQALCEALPISAAELLEVPGFGKARVARYGEVLIEMIQDYCARHQVEKTVYVAPAKKTRRKTGSPKPDKISSARTSLHLFLEGRPVEEIARERNLAVSTIQGHLTDCVTSGELPVEQYLDPPTLRNIQDCLEAHPDLSVTELLRVLGEGFSYYQVRAVIGHRKRQQEATANGSTA